MIEKLLRNPLLKLEVGEQPASLMGNVHHTVGHQPNEGKTEEQPNEATPAKPSPTSFSWLSHSMQVREGWNEVREIRFPP